MPRVFSKASAKQDAADVAAYLAGQGSAGAAAAAGTADDGGRLFANLDCLACHPTPDNGAGDPGLMGRVPLAQVKAKFKPAALVRYLIDPQAQYRWNPMPNFRLSEQEAGDL